MSEEVIEEVKAGAVNTKTPEIEADPKKSDVMASVVHKDTDPVVSAKELLAVGAHYGHQARRWNPAMAPYIYTKRNNMHILDLNKSAELIQKAFLALKKIVAEGGKVIFVGTKPIAKETILNEATRSGSFYANNRWLGGTLTNFKTIYKRIKLLKDLQDATDDGQLDKLPKKEAFAKAKERDRLNALLGGIKEMRKTPNALVVVDSNWEHNAVHEAKLLHIPTFGLIDTNCDPSDVDYPIPVNVDGPESVKLVIGLLADAVVAGKGGDVVYAYKSDASDSSGMKDILPTQFSIDDLKVIHAKIREDIFAAKRKGKKHHKKASKKFVKRGPRPQGEKKSEEGANPSAPVEEKKAEAKEAPAKKEESKTEGE